MARAVRRRPPSGEQLPLDLGLEPPVGVCAWCHEPILRGHGVILRRAYRFGVCLVSLHRACAQEAGDEGVARLVADREARWAARLGLRRSADAGRS